MLSKGKGKGKVHPITCHEGTEESGFEVFCMNIS